MIHNPSHEYLKYIVNIKNFSKKISIYTLIALTCSITLYIYNLPRNC